MAGNVYFPKDFTENRQYSAIVVVHPGGGVKEQTAGLYAQMLAEHGFVTLAFDASHQGASGGMLRFLDNPVNRVGDIYSAVDYLTSLKYVDASRIGALGICAGSGAAVKAATTERRIKALGTVSAVDVGAATRKGWTAKRRLPMRWRYWKNPSPNKGRPKPPERRLHTWHMFRRSETRRRRAIFRQESDYYLTSGGEHPNAPNKMLTTSLSYLVSFTGFDQVDTLLTQPLMIVAGSEAGSLWHSQELNSKAAGPEGILRRGRRYGYRRRQRRCASRREVGAILQAQPVNVTCECPVAAVTGHLARSMAIVCEAFSFLYSPWDTPIPPNA